MRGWLGMTQYPLPDYSELEQALSETVLKLHPSQVHGILCGVLSGNVSGTLAWEELVVGSKDTSKSHTILQALYAASAKQLNDFLFEFQLVLPDDTEKLSVRAEAMTLWCQGYLTGLKLAQVQMIGREAGDVTEAINDLIEIAKMNYEDVVAGEEDESAYVELVEYVRMAVILIYQDIHESADPTTATRCSHHLH